MCFFRNFLQNDILFVQRKGNFKVLLLELFCKISQTMNTILVNQSQQPFIFKTFTGVITSVQYKTNFVRIHSSDHQKCSSVRHVLHLWVYKKICLSCFFYTLPR